MRTLTTVVITATICLLAAGCGGSGTKTAGTPTTASSDTTSSTTTSATPTTTSAAPVAESALDSLLLSPSEIDAATGATGMRVAATSNALATDIQLPADAPAEKIACIGVAGTAEAQAYADSGSTAVRDQALQMSDASGGQATAGQSVVLFGSADQAKAFFDRSTKNWRACREFGGGGSTTTVAPVSTDNDTLSTIMTTKSANGVWVCERALRVANNVAIEASACGSEPQGAALSIAAKIADKVPGR